MAWLLSVVCPIALALVCIHSVSAASLLPYGTEHGDTLADQDTTSVILTEGFTFLGESFTTVRVNRSGALQLGPASGGTGEKFIAPFLGETDLSLGGSVFYRSTSNSSLVQQVSNIVTANFAGTAGLTLSSLFIATWFQVSANGGLANKQNTFQCVLAYSGSVTYVLFLYEENVENWWTPAVVGFRNGESLHFTLPTSGTQEVLEIAQTSNTGQTGRWLFRVDGTQVSLPAPLVELERVSPVSESAGSGSVCVVLHSSSPPRAVSLSLTVDGTTGPSLSFSATSQASARQCVSVTITDDALVENDETIPVELVYSGSGLITILPSSVSISVIDDDMLIGWESAEPRRVSEDIGSVQLCAILTSAQPISQSVTVTLVTRRNGVSNVDFSLTDSELIFQRGTSRACVDVTIVDDTTVENDETLSVVLRRADNDRVTFSPDTTATITITDNGDNIYIQPFPLLGVSESVGNQQVCVGISGSIERGFELQLTLREGTARAGVHFTDVSGVSTVPPGRGYCFSVPIINDDIYNIQGTDFTGLISSPDPAVRLDSTPFPIHINDDDATNFGITFSQLAFTGSENDDSMDVCVSIEKGRLGPGSRVSVNLTTNTRAFVVDESEAKEKIDYAESERIITFDDSYTTASDPECVRVPIFDDDILEDQETYIMEIVKMDPNVDYELLPFTARCVINDNDIVYAAVENTHVVVEEGSGVKAEVCLLINEKRAIDLEMRARPVRGNATAGRDYIGTPLDFTFYKDENRACVYVPILNDFLVEALYETFFVGFTAQNQLVIFNQSRATVTIKDIDILRYQTVVVDDLTNVDETELCLFNNTGRVCVLTSGRLDINVAISFHTLDATAVAGEDYTPFNETRVVRPQDIIGTDEGLWNYCFGFCTKDDNIVEGDESFYIVISPHTDRIKPFDSFEDRFKITILDNDMLRVYPSQSTVTVSEGVRQVDICANMVGLSERPVDLLLSTTDFTAIEGVDYEILNRTIHFPSYLTVYGHLNAVEVAQFALNPPVTTHCVPVRIIDDSILEATSSKVFHIQFSTESLDADRITIESGVTVTIQDDDQVIMSLAEATTVIDEGNQRVRVQLSLIGSADFEISASISTRTTDGPNAATPEEDFSPVRGTGVVLQAGYTTGDPLEMELTVSIRDDSLFEDTETFQIVLSSTSNGVVLGSPSVKTVHILDNDNVEVGLQDGEFRVLEGDLHAPVCSYLRGATEKVVQVNATTSPGTAGAGVDYSPNPVPLLFVFPPSTEVLQTQCIRYSVVDDEILESVESFYVEISTNVPRVTIGLSTATVSLVDNDGVYVSLLDRELSVEENAAAGEGGAEISMCVQMTGIIQTEVEISLFTVAGTAQVDTDFVSAIRSVVFTPMDTANQTKCATFTYVDDNVAEDTEFFFVNLTTSNTAGVGEISILTNRARIQILDSDQVSIQFEHPTYTVTEGEDGELEVCVELGARIQKEITVQFSAVAETAQHYSDFSQVDSQLTFRSRGSTRECTPIVLMDDELLEDDEQFSVYILFSDPSLYVPGLHPSASNSSAVVTIADNDYVTVQLEHSLYEVQEGERDGVLSVCSILNGMTGKEVPITFAFMQGTAQNVSDSAHRDFSAPVNRLVTFQVSSEEVQTQCVEVTVDDDDRVEDVETFHVEISTTVPRIRIGGNTATVRVTDNDVVDVAMTSQQLSVDEGETVSVCVSRSGVIEKTVTVGLSLEPRSAQAGSDFTREYFQIRFSPSSVAQRNECANFSTHQDDVVELTETFVVRLSSSASFVSVSLNETVVSIVDSDTTSVEFERSSYTISEADDTLSVCVVLGAVIERNANVRLVTRDASAVSDSDFNSIDTELTFQSRGSTRVCADIRIENDNAVEDTEQFFVSLNVTDESLYTGDNSESSSVLVTITDNDRVTVSFEREELSVEEEEGEVELCVRLLGIIEKDVIILLAPVPDTAHADTDYVATSSSILFQPTLSSINQNCITFSIVNDERVESTESFFIQLATTGDEQIVLDRARTRVLIEDTDMVYVNFTELSQTVSEGDGAATVCVELEAEVESEVRVQLATDDGTARQPRDFDRTYKVLMFEPLGETRQCVDISITDDEILEDEEQFLVYIFDSERSRVRENEGGRGYVEVVPPGSGTEVEVLSGGVRSVVAIRDNDRVTIGMTVSEYTVEESSPEVTVCLQIDGEIERKVDVSMRTVPGTARPSNDFFAVTITVTFTPQSTTEGECVSVQLIDRPAVEPDEKFSVSLFSDDPAVFLQPKDTSILILDDDVVCASGRTFHPRGDYYWAQSRPGRVEQPCQHSKEGVAVRECNRGGVWNLPILDECYGDIDTIFKDLENAPFTCHNFYELLLAVRQATKEKAFEIKYISIVARFFSDFADITSRDGYNTEFMTCRRDLDTFTVGVGILDQLMVWPREVLWTNSTSILGDFETVSEHVVANPESADKTITHSNIAFSSSLVERVDLEKDGVVMKFSGNTKATLEVDTSSRAPVLGTIQLPSSLFLSLDDKEVTEVGLWFSLHRTANLFPLLDFTSENDSVSTPVISATLGGHHVDDLSEPVRFTLRLLDQSVTDTNCASWDFDTEGWTTDGCETESVKDGYVTCSCNHLTNFAAVGASLIPPQPLIRERPSLALSIVSLVGVMLALVALILTIFVLLTFSKLRKRRTTILRAQLCFSLLFLLLAYVGHIIINHTGTLPQDIVPPCAAISVFTHYFTLTSLIWLGAEALLMFRKLMFGKKLGDLSNFYFVSASTTSWLVPIPFASIPAVLNRDWIITDDQYCFISSLPVFLVTFVIPAAVALAFNLVIYTVVICVFIRFKCKKAPPLTEGNATTASKKKKLMKKSRREATLRLIFSSPATGTLFVLAWIFGALTLITAEASIGFHLLSALFSAALGWFIFIYYIVTAKDTRKLIHEAFCGKPRKNLNANQVISMESLSMASGMDESDSDSDYPERERRYGEFDITYVGRKAALIEQKFSVRWGDGERGEGKEVRVSGERRDPGSRAEEGNAQSVSGQVIFAAFTPSSTESEDKPERSSVAEGDTSAAGATSLEAVLEEKSNGEFGGPDESPVHMGSHRSSQEDVNSDEGSPRASTSRKNFLSPGGQVVFLVTPTT